MSLMPGSRRFKITLVCAAKRANPIFGQVFKRCAGVDAISRVTFSGIIDVVTDYTAVLGHGFLLG
jgi:hypothetical protein